jgi:hypothetical protein
VTPYFIAGLAVVGLFGVWQLVRFSRLVGRTSAEHLSQLREPFVSVRCGTAIRGARGEGRFVATWPFARLLVTPDVLVVRTPVGDWEFPKNVSEVDVTFRSPLALRVRRGVLTAGISMSRDRMDATIDTMRSNGWAVVEASAPAARTELTNGGKSTT